MVDLCTSIEMVVLKLDWKSLFMVQNVEWSAKSCDFTIWIPDTHIVWHSEEYGNQVFEIQMVIVLQ